MPDERQPASEAVQNYLKIIYELTAGTAGQRAGTSQIAERLAVRAASVTGMLQKLADDGLIDYRKQKGARLTPQGLEIALRVIRHHRLIETFLHEKLGFSWDEVHDEAEALEHAISAAVSQRMADMLGNPRRDPHGDPIPTRHLQMRAGEATCLVDFPAGSRGQIVRISDQKPALLRQAGRLGLRPGVSFAHIGRSSAGIQIRLDGQSQITLVPPPLDGQIYVERENP